MNKLVRIPTESEDFLVLEIEEPEKGLEMFDFARGPAEEVFDAKEKLEDALDRMKGSLKVVFDKIKEIPDLAPNQIEVELGLAFTAEAGFVVAKGSASANFKVKVVWKSDRT
ncbi:MAG: CU044_2847 family protein [Desulfomonilaceae bacterium]